MKITFGPFDSYADTAAIYIDGAEVGGIERGLTNARHFQVYTRLDTPNVAPLRSLAGREFTNLSRLKEVVLAVYEREAAGFVYDPAQVALADQIIEEIFNEEKIVEGLIAGLWALQGVRS